MKTWESECGRVRLWCGEALATIREWPEESIDAVVTDPPYSSGGQFRSDRVQTTVAKYVQTGQAARGDYQDFTGDNRDQRSFEMWATLWLSELCLRSTPGATVCCFTDWRQLPTMTDALQAGGWTWRNLATWWKPGCRMQKGRFSQSAEYVLYGTYGPHDPTEEERAVQNVFSCQTIRSDGRAHIAEKPEEVMSWVLSPSRGRVVDPFMGSGSTGVAAVRQGREFWGIELSRRYFETSKRRISEELKRQQFLDGRTENSGNKERELFEVLGIADEWDEQKVPLSDQHDRK